MAKRLVLMFCLMLTAATLWAQTQKVNGTVVDDQGEPLIGVVVNVQGHADRKAVTDIDGNFHIDAQTGEVLQFSYIGMKQKNIALNKKTGLADLKIAMESDSYNMEEVVVTGYGTSRKRDLTGAIVSVSGDDLKTSPNVNVMNSLQGKVPGLVVTAGGSAGNTPDIKIRGIGTVNSSTAPLYIVDGMFVGDINFLSQNDIESIEVLKDPSSLAIFGVQGANGVIIITTRRPKGEKVNVSYEGYVGVQTVWRRDRVKLTDATQFTELYNEQLKNQDPTATSWVPGMLGKGTDWLSKILRNAVITNHSLTVSKASQKSNTTLSIGYLYQDGVVKYNNYQRFTVRFAQDYNIGKYVKVGGNVNLSRADNDPATASVQQAVQAVPTYMPYASADDYNTDDIGSPYTPSPDIQINRGNPMLGTEINKGMTDDRTYRVVGNLYGEVNFLKDFTLRVAGYGDLGFYRRAYRTQIYNQTTNQVNKNKISAFSRNSDEGRVYQADITLNWKKTIAKKHSVNATAGYTARKNESEGFSAAADSIAGGISKIPADMWMLSQGNADRKSNGDWWNAESFVSYLGRVTYTYDNKYTLTATFRADGSSKFAPNKRWGYFPSFGASWVMSEEKWMQGTRKWLDFLKLRASWGKLGNDKIGNYLYYPTINPTGKQVILNGQTVYIPTTDYEVDDKIHWEVMSGFDFGASFQMFRSRLNGEIGYYTKTTDDLLAHVSINSALGQANKITNAGSINNRGIEVSLSWRDKIGQVSYGVSGNLATVRNRVTKLGNDNTPIYAYGSNNYQSHITAVGHAIGSFYGYVQDGIFQTEQEVQSYANADGELLQPDAKPGDIRYKDINGDGKFNSDDRTIIGNPMPDVTYGFGFNAAWRGFDLSFDFNGVAGNKILDLKRTIADVPVNFYEKDLGRWHGEGTSNFQPILDKTRGGNFLMSDNLLENGSYIRLRSAQIGYTLPTALVGKWGITSCRFYLQGQNLLTWKHNSGFTPEIGGGILNAGVDQGDTYPIPATYTFGVSLQF